jgi:peptidoglycan/LPS O-acetylase OafA/YrhL
LVVNLHCCVTYSHVGDWYIKSGPEGSLSEKLPWIFWIFHLQSFFMGLLFFLAGALAHNAILRRGAMDFLRERCIRLGLPALLYMAVLHPLIVYGLLGARGPNPNDSWFSVYSQYVLSGRILSGSGPLWFVLALLMFSAVFAIWRGLRPDRNSTEPSLVPQVRAIVIFALALALATALTRTVFPIGTSVLNFQLGYFPQYVAAFAVGTLAGKGVWLNELAASRRAQWAGWGALIFGPLFLGVLLFLGGGPTEGPNPGEHGPILYFGGWSFQAFGAAAWEQFTGVGLALGMMAAFKRSFWRETTLSRWMADRSFAVYLVHAPILVALTLLLEMLLISPFAHVALLTVSGLILSFAAADIANRLPGLRLIL